MKVLQIYSDWFLITFTFVYFSSILFAYVNLSNEIWCISFHVLSGFFCILWYSLVQLVPLKLFVVKFYGAVYQYAVIKVDLWHWLFPCDHASIVLVVQVSYFYFSAFLGDHAQFLLVLNMPLIPFQFLKLKAFIFSSQLTVLLIRTFPLWNFIFTLSLLASINSRCLVSLSKSYSGLTWLWFTFFSFVSSIVFKEL